MANPLFSLLNSPMAAPQQQVQQNRFSDMMQRFNQFRQNFNGNPQQIAQSMIQSGRLSQDQVNQLTQMTNQFVSMFGSSK